METSTVGFTKEWKSSVNRNSEEWRAYCEACHVANLRMQSGDRVAKQYLTDVKLRRGTAAANQLEKMSLVAAADLVPIDSAAMAAKPAGNGELW